VVIAEARLQFKPGKAAEITESLIVEIVWSSTENYVNE
jgi:hypothetical protein